MNSRLGIVTAAFLFSTGGAAIKSCALGGWTVASWRSGIAALTLLLLLPATRKIPKRSTLLVAVSYAATLLLFVLANKNTTAANAIFLQSTAPIYILLLSPKLLGETNTRRDWVQLLVTAIGLGFFLVGLPPAQVTAPNPALGNMLGMAAGITWSLTLMGLRWTAREDEDGYGGARAALWGNVLAFAAALPLAGVPLDAAPATLGILLYLGVVQIGFAYAALTTAFRSVPAAEASLLLMLEPALNPIWAWFVHGEQTGVLALVGGALIIGAGAWRTWGTSPEIAHAA